MRMQKLEIFIISTPFCTYEYLICQQCGIVQ